MGSPDKAAVLQKVIRFKQLDNRRIELGALSPLEEKEWSALKRDIGRVLFREKFRAGQAEKRAAIRVPTNLHATFKDKEAFQRVREAGVITKASLAELYHVRQDEILEVTFFEPADALKISMKRWVSSAAPGDTDVFGAQQHVPLMLLEVGLDWDGARSPPQRAPHAPGLQGAMP